MQVSNTPFPKSINSAVLPDCPPPNENISLMLSQLLCLFSILLLNQAQPEPEISDPRRFRRPCQTCHLRPYRRNTDVLPTAIFSMPCPTPTPEPVPCPRRRSSHGVRDVSEQVEPMGECRHDSHDYQPGRCIFSSSATPCPTPTPTPCPTPVPTSTPCPSPTPTPVPCSSSAGVEPISIAPHPSGGVDPNVIQIDDCSCNDVPMQDQGGSVVSVQTSTVTASKPTGSSSVPSDGDASGGVSIGLGVPMAGLAIMAIALLI